MAFLLYWCFESSIEAKQIIEHDLKSGQYNGKDTYKQVHYLSNKIK